MATVPERNRIRDGWPDPAPGYSAPTVGFFSRRKGSVRAESEQAHRAARPAVREPEDSAGEPDLTSPLVDRLRRLEWPTAPEEVKERCLAEILSRVGQPQPAEVGDEGDRPD